jgi:hypothetical protein
MRCQALLRKPNSRYFVDNIPTNIKIYEKAEPLDYNIFVIRVQKQ